MIGQGVAKSCRAALASPSLRKASSLPSSALRLLMPVVGADYGRISGSAIRTLSDVRPARLLCLAINILFIVGGAVWCVSGYGLAAGLIIAVLAVAPVLTLLDIALFAGMEEGRGSPGAISTTRQIPERRETLDVQCPSIIPENSEIAVPESFATALDENGKPQDKSENPNFKGENTRSAQTQHESLIGTANQRIEPRLEVHATGGARRPAVRSRVRKPTTHWSFSRTSAMPTKRERRGPA